ncbi:MAG TPA: hypothetical protein VGF21_00790 [Thermoleophilaceae bacterium]
MTRAARIAALVVVAAALPSAPAAAQSKGPTVVMTGGLLYHTEDVPPNSIRTFTVTCPPGYVAMSGTATDADGSTQLGSVPKGARSWTFSFGQPVTAARTAHVIVLVVCSKPRPFLPGIAGKLKVKVKTKALKSPDIVIPPGDSESTKLKCPSGAAPTGSGESVAPAEAQPKGERARAAAVLSNGLVARETRDLPVRGGFRFTVRNPAAVPQTVRHYGRCLYRRASYRRRHGRKHRARTKVLRLLFNDTAQPGSNLFQHSCPRRTFPLSAGHEYASDEDMIVFGHAVGRPRRVLTPVISQEDVPEEFRHPLLCEPGALSKRALR